MSSEKAKLNEMLEKNGFDIGENKYRFAKMPFKKGRKIFSYMTIIAPMLDRNNLSFIDSEKFEDEIEPVLFKHLLVNDCLLSTLPDHFEEHTGEYEEAIVAAIQGFSAPFLPETASSSALDSRKEQTTTFKKRV